MPSTPTPGPGAPDPDPWAALGLRDTILIADDLPIEVVHVPQWGVTVGVKAMSMERRGEMAARAADPVTGEVDFRRLWAEIVVTGSVGRRRVGQAPDIDHPLHSSRG